MPQLGLTMEEGEISEWKVAEGDVVKEGDVIAEITTDKLTNDLVAEFGGTVLKIVAKEGEDIPVKETLLWLGEPGEEIPGEKKVEEKAPVSEKPVAPAAVKPQAPPAATPPAAAPTAAKPAAKPKANPAGKTRIAIIGSGPGGYVAAIRAAQLGAEVTIVEKGSVGGTCLNVGCIPTKAILHSGVLYQNILHDTKANGITVSGVSFDWSKVIAKKDKVVKQLVGGVRGLLKKNKVTVVEGLGRLGDGKTIVVKSEKGEETTIEYDKLILASGSRPAIPPIPGVKDNPDCIDSTAALAIDQLPKTMVVVGGGVIGIEFATAFANFGVKVQVVEATSKILPLMDEKMSADLRGYLEKDGIEIFTDAKVLEVKKNGATNDVIVELAGEKKVFSAEKVLVAVGRRTETEDLGLDKYGIANDRGRITVNEYMETSKEDVYAIGDCVGQIMLAHIASAMGEIAVENAMGERKVFDAKTNPSCVYTNVEFAGVGFSEGDLEKKGVSYNVGTFPLVGNGKALIENGGKGSIKVLTSKEYGEILGVHILGPRATDLIAEAALVIGLEMTADEVIETIHAHPTLAEATREAVMATEKRAIHF